MRRHTLASLVTLVVFLLLPVVAYAQTAPSDSADVLSAKQLAWIGFASAVASFLAPWFDPANTKTPWELSAPARGALFAVLGAVTGVLHGFSSSTPWTTSLAVGISTFVLPLLAHFLPYMKKRRVVATGATLACLFFGASGITACTPAQGAADVNLGKCILARATVDVLAGDTDQQIADDVITYCEGAEVNAVNSVIPDARAQAASVKAKGAGK